jgi:hypothetical protein
LNAALRARIPYGMTSSPLALLRPPSGGAVPRARPRRLMRARALAGPPARRTDHTTRDGEAPA